MAVHSKLWYLERFRLFDVLTAAQKVRLEAATRMLEVKRGERIYLQDFKERGLVNAQRRSIRITDPSRLRLVS